MMDIDALDYYNNTYLYILNQTEVSIVFMIPWSPPSALPISLLSLIILSKFFLLGFNTRNPELKLSGGKASGAARKEAFEKP